LTASFMSNAGSNLGAAGWGNIAGLALTPVAWLSFPFVVGNAVAQALFPLPTAPVAPLAATARSAARLASGTSTTSPAASRDFGFRQARPNPAARSKRSIATPATPESSARAKPASAASKRRSTS
jgi:hypothetical protein